MVGDGAATLVARAFAAAGLEPPPDALERFLAIYDTRLLNHTRPYPRMAEVLDVLGTRAALAVLTNKPLGSTRSILAGLDLARHSSTTRRCVGGDGPFPRKPDPAGLRHLVSRARMSCAPRRCSSAIRSIDWRTAPHASTPFAWRATGSGSRGFRVDELGPADRSDRRAGRLLAL